MNDLVQIVKMADNRKGGGTNATDAAWSEMMGESA